MANRLVRLGVRGAVATITLDSPANRNALSADLRRDLATALDAAFGDRSVRVLVLSHTGPVFCAGLDLMEAKGATADEQGAGTFADLLAAIWDGPKPVVARLAGAARAGGIGLMAACDVAVTADDVTFAFTEVRLGLVPAVISVPVLARMHPTVAHELFLTGERFDAARAVQMGLVNSAVPADRLDAEVLRYTGLLALGAPGALAATKALLRQRAPSDFAEAMARSSRLSAWHFASDEGQEGIRAFAEKRAPAWVLPEGD